MYPLCDEVHAIEAVCGVSVSVSLQVVGDVVRRWCGLQGLLDSLQCSLLLKGGPLGGQVSHGLHQPLLDGHSLPTLSGLLFPAASAAFTPPEVCLKTPTWQDRWESEVTMQRRSMSLL